MLVLESKNDEWCRVLFSRKDLLALQDLEWVNFYGPHQNQ